jgi:hypothetical protein
LALNDIYEAHAHSSLHRVEIEASEICGCFCCLGAFLPSEITEWVDEVGDTALCPRCGVDAVIGPASGVPLDKRFLGLMQKHWF